MISAWESLHFATLELVRSTPIKQRLINAYRKHLCSLPDDNTLKEERILYDGALFYTNVRK